MELPGVVYDVTFYQPIHCRVDAYTSLRDQLPQLHQTSGLVRSAVAVSMHELDDPDPVKVEAELDDYAQQVLDRVVGADPRALVAHTHLLLFEEARFRGNLGDYENPRNSYLSSVLRTRLGLPISLTLVYKAVLERVGVPVLGINAPGHFLAGIPALASGMTQANSDLALVDPFSGGRLLTRKEALQRVANLAGPSLLLDGDLLAPATHKQWLLRMIRNLMSGFERKDQQDDLAAMLEMLRLVEDEAE
ncbi:MAG: transglutaminase-like domain-containing protein [Planctomycetota bacterium]